MQAGLLKEFIMLEVKRQKTRTLYHIGSKPPKPVRKEHAQQWWDAKVPPAGWNRWWHSKRVESGVFMSDNPIGVARNHGRHGNIYVYDVPELGD